MTTYKHLRRIPRVFLLTQAILLVVATAWAYHRVARTAARQALPALRQHPLDVAPLYDEPTVISDEQLSRVLHKLVLRDRGPRTKINHVDHALRLWGPEAVFDQPGTISGHAMQRLLLDHRAFAKRYGDKTPPLLIDDARGPRMRVQQGLATSSHYDHTIACLAEAGTPLDFPVFTSRRETTFRTLVERSLRKFRLNQVEYEWSALTYALYLPPATSWTNEEGQRITFDILARRIMREPLTRGVCLANHRMHALVVLLRVDEQSRILSPETRREITGFLSGVTARLVAAQSVEGYWDLNWAEPSKPRDADRRPTDSARGDRILATGHPLEWWALAPREVLPPRPVLVAAGQWLSRTIDELSPDEVNAYYTYLSHAGRALALWRGKRPADVLGDTRRNESSGPSAKKL